MPTTITIKYASDGFKQLVRIQEKERSERLKQYIQQAKYHPKIKHMKPEKVKGDSLDADAKRFNDIDLGKSTKAEEEI